MASFPQACPTIVCDSSNQCLWHSSSPALRRRRTTCCVPAACGGRAMLFGRERDARVCVLRSCSRLLFSLCGMQSFSCFCLFRDARPLVPTHPQLGRASTVSPTLFMQPLPSYGLWFSLPLSGPISEVWFGSSLWCEVSPPTHGVRERDTHWCGSDAVLSTRSACRPRRRPSGCAVPIGARRC